MRKFLFSAVIAVPLMLSACGHSGKPDPGPGPSLALPSRGETPKVSAVPDEQSGLLLPRGARMLLPQRSGKGSQALPGFYSKEGPFTVYVRCTGQGSANLREEGTTSHESIPCDGSLTKYAVIDNPKEHRMALDAGTGVQWTMAVVAG